MTVTIPLIAADGSRSTVTLPAPVMSQPTPLGVSGSWTIALNEDFNGSSLNTNIWQYTPWPGGTGMNNVAIPPSNVSVSNSNLVLTLSNSTTGSLVSSLPGNPSNAGFAIGGECVWEARINFPGDGTHLYNWPAFWILRGKPLPDVTVEVDIAEVWSGAMSTNYHVGYGAPNPLAEGFNYSGAYLGDAFHVWTLHRTATTNYVYIDGVLFKSFAVGSGDGGAQQDTGLPMYVMFNSGIQGPYQHTPTKVLVDYVRAWYPSGTTPYLTY